MQTTNDIEKILFTCANWMDDSKLEELRQVLQAMDKPYELHFSLSGSRYHAGTYKLLIGPRIGFQIQINWGSIPRYTHPTGNTCLEKRTADGGLKMLALTRRAKEKGACIGCTEWHQMESYFKGRITVDQAVGLLQFNELRGGLT